MKPGGVVADEMFPEGAGPYMDLEEVRNYQKRNYNTFKVKMKSLK